VLACRPSKVLKETNLCHLSICQPHNCTLKQGILSAAAHPENRLIHMLTKVQHQAVVMSEFTDSGMLCTLVPFVARRQPVSHVR
jgi:hypothetical protein